MTAFKILGVTISPLHCKNADVREFNCENGIISEYTKKYAVAFGQIAGSPPNRIGSGWLSKRPLKAKRPEMLRALIRPCRMTFLASES